jgi:eukaryotic-like serine/threonine-protein kinase
MSSYSPSDPGDRSETFEDGPIADLLRAWQEGRQPQLEAFVAGFPEISPDELAAVVRVDIDVRWRRKDPRRAESYLASFPALADDPELAVDVIYAEYLAREQAGDCPGIAEYQQRFPAFADVLSEQIWLHRALEIVDDDTDVSRSDPSVVSAFESRCNAQRLDAGYEILEEIGRGGMGVVYKARQVALKRFVALKMVRAVDASNLELLARFRAEARVVASLHHPHIVQVYDFGEHDGLPFLAMELIECGTLAARLDGTPWAPLAAADLLIKLSGAVECAHERGIIHRDLKPANVLIASDAKGLEAKISDFGLAKFFHDETSLHTRSVAFLGTPSYMAPEQASGGARDVGPATDVYALGAILYELLTGRPPFRGGSPIDTLRQMLAAEPVPLERLAPNVPRDLATICDKCLRTEVKRRYGSAAELRADLERFIAGVPVQARRIHSVERAWRWCRRNPSWAVALGSMAALLVGIAAVSLWSSNRLGRELAKTQQAEQSERAANQSTQHHLWDAYLTEVAARNESRHVGQRFAALDTIDKAAALLDTIGRTEERALKLRNAILSSAALPDMRILRTLGERLTGTTACDLSVAADRYLLATQSGSLICYRLSDGRRLWNIEHSPASFKFLISPDGRFAAATNDRDTIVWRVDGPQPQVAWQADGVKFFTFAPDGQHAACSDPSHGMRLVKVASGETVRTLGRGAGKSQFSFHAATGRIAVCGATSVQVISGKTGSVECELPLLSRANWRLAWHPGGQFLAVWDRAEGVWLWDIRTQTRRVLFPHRGVPAQLCFSNDGSLLVSYDLWNERLLIWDVGSGQRLLEVPGFASGACDVSSEGQILFLRALGDNWALTELAGGACRSLAIAMQTPLGSWFNASVSPEGRVLALSSEHGLELWDLTTAQRLVASTLGLCMAEFDGDGRLIVGCQRGIYRWPRQVEVSATSPDEPEGTPKPSARTTIVQFGPPEQLTGPIEPTSLSTNAQGESLVFRGSDGWAVARLDGRFEKVRLQTKHDPRRSAVSNDNRYAAIANWERAGVAIWDVTSGAHLADLAVGQHGVVRFSPDGRLLAATPDGVTLWSTGDWRRVGQLQAHGTTPTGLGITFSPDSRVLAVGQSNGILRLVDPTSGNDWASLSHWDLSGAVSLAFSPDQRYLITSSLDERSPAQIWDLTVMRRELTQRGLNWPTEVLAPATSASPMAGQLEMVFDGGDLVRSYDAAASGQTDDVWQDFFRLLQWVVRPARK